MPGIPLASQSPVPVFLPLLIRASFSRRRFECIDPLENLSLAPRQRPGTRGSPALAGQRPGTDGSPAQADQRPRTGGSPAQADEFSEVALGPSWTLGSLTR